MNWRILMAMGVLGTVACSGGSKSEETSGDDDNIEEVDSDEDGLSDAEEEEMGLDPDSDDSDGDGVLDGDEIDLGLDPLVVDSDGDGYGDGDEIAEGKDPADAESVIYKGGWPYSAAKSELDEAAVPNVVEVGKLFAHFTAKDQFTDTVDLWDFHNDEGKYIIVDISAQWCGPCNSMALWMDGGIPEWDNEWPGVRDAVNNGDAYWVTVLGEKNNYTPARQSTTEAWYEEYPNPNMPVLADIDYTTRDFVQLSSWPTVIVLNPDMTVAWMPTGDEYWIHGMEFMVDNL